MYEAIVIKKIVGDGMEFFEGSRVRILMKPNNPNRPDLANEYIGIIYKIEADYFELLDGYDFRAIITEDIDRMRLTKENETFANTWNFDD